MSTAISETYVDVERYLWDLSHQFKRQYGGDLEEIIGEARLHYVRAFRTHEQSKGGLFTSWLRSKVWWGLLDRKRKEARHASRLTRVDLDLDKLPSRRGLASILSDSTNEDVATLMELLRESPGELRALLRMAPERRRNGLWDYLRGVGWTAQRIRETFEEILEAMGE